MIAFDHPLLHLSLKIAVGVACTVATGVAVTYVTRYLIRDHNSTASRRELRARKRRVLDVLRGIEAECVDIIEPQIQTVCEALDGVAPAAEAALATGAFQVTESRQTKKRGQKTSVEKKLRVATRTPKSSAPDSPLSATTSLTSLPSPTSSTTSISMSPLIPLMNTSTVDRRLHEIDDQLVRLLEKLDAVSPQDIILPSYISSDVSLDETVEIDPDVIKVMDQAVEIIRTRKKVLVKRVQSLVEEVDRLCEVAGIPSVGAQHARCM
ncbi:uncharacterized protein SPPG_08368 [Spizellomyces punctatus DAOM BR117]|uniref:BAG domain-containing protein n=1 Tax=Spizellomyces punctatus (strain DAOM BR117) TaxID=645134 RepID=A0A0L0H405_SPIPD|nr:uncharacterized protein SPPG_08368 [Spizellomyces punctatus DAOM BR117]KNC96215.1 hypothetical protein SPPG_08368 [Spizellomyces punctatus DAOM BR117]|eukprot:XP_016604255.1 hypothetical protein SPPG_08368 [Spizellomyces punctatus DAOM BR117]